MMNRSVVCLSSLLALACLLLSTTPAHAGAKPFSQRPLWIGVGGAGGASAEDPAGVGYFHLTTGIRLLPVSIELTVREGRRGQTASSTHLTGVAAGARILLPRILMLQGYFRIAYSHQKETGWGNFLQAPVRTFFGVEDGLNSRNGIEAGGGLEVSLGPLGPGGTIGLWAQGTVLLFPDSPGPIFTSIIEGGLFFALGPKLGAG
ncbi:MAG: hypothetical protein VX498_00490 [Myxococcota bacterium]|nr:hypothetical protein [Myxococcota bacterium]